MSTCEYRAKKEEAIGKEIRTVIGSLTLISISGGSEDDQFCTHPIAAGEPCPICIDPNADNPQECGLESADQEEK
jgi:hypothetical protein